MECGQNVEKNLSQRRNAVFILFINPGMEKLL